MELNYLVFEIFYLLPFFGIRSVSRLQGPFDFVLMFLPYM